MEEVTLLDVYPQNDEAQFNGTWSNYPYFPSGVVAVSHIDEGIFFVQPTIQSPEPGCLQILTQDLVVSVADLLIMISEFAVMSNCETDSKRRRLSKRRRITCLPCFVWLPC